MKSIQLHCDGVLVGEYPATTGGLVEASDAARALVLEGPGEEACVAHVFKLETYERVEVVFATRRECYCTRHARGGFGMCDRYESDDWNRAAERGLI